MNNNKKNNKVLLIIFIFALYVPTITFFFIKNNINYDNNEKRKLAEKPTLSLSKIQSYPKEFDLYYNDNLPYRNYIIKNWRTMNYLIFNEAIDERVLIGKNELNEPWLFYDNKKDDEISYINGKKTVDEKKINNIANVIKLQTKKLKDKDIDLYYIIAPNKSSVYSEYLPKNVEVKDDYFEKAYKLIKNKGITNVYYDLNILKESKKNFETYYRTDTHWNDYGTYIYIKNILNKIYKKNLFLNEKISQEVVDSNSGDLHTFLGVSVNIKDTQTNVDFSNKADIKPKIIKKEYGDIEIYDNKNSQLNETIIVVGDSFSNNSTKFFSSIYRKVIRIYLRSTKYDESVLDEFKPNKVFYIKVERYTPGCLGFEFIK